jgi:hypothetical protein
MLNVANTLALTSRLQRDQQKQEIFDDESREGGQPWWLQQQCVDACNVRCFLLVLERSSGGPCAVIVSTVCPLGVSSFFCWTVVLDLT